MPIFAGPGSGLGMRDKFNYLLGECLKALSQASLIRLAPRCPCSRSNWPDARGESLRVQRQKVIAATKADEYNPGSSKSLVGQLGGRPAGPCVRCALRPMASSVCQRTHSILDPQFRRHLAAANRASRQSSCFRIPRITHRVRRRIWAASHPPKRSHLPTAKRWFSPFCIPAHRKPRSWRQSVSGRSDLATPPRSWKTAIDSSASGSTVAEPPSAATGFEASGAHCDHFDRSTDCTVAGWAYGVDFGRLKGVGALPPNASREILVGIQFGGDPRQNVLPLGR
ncbi:hypothetical protein FQR65_LT18039 [Abscondita terminalis]|nr:hypothetical protein FQR65_LT18039 [Abscondita terminalis]